MDGALCLERNLTNPPRTGSNPVLTTNFKIVKESYRLIKEYPGSEKLGTIFTFDESWGKYKTKNKINGKWDKDYFQNGINVYYEIL